MTTRRSPDLEGPVPGHDPAGIFAVVLASTIWGSSFVLAKLAMYELPVTHVILFRFALAAVPLVPVLLLLPERMDRRDVPLFALTGFLMVPVTFFLQFGGLSLTSATSTALMVGVGAPLLALGGVVFERERLGIRGWTAVAVSTAGVVVLVGPGAAGGDVLGDLMVLASIVVSVVWILTSKRLTARYSALYATGWIIVFGTLFLIPLALAWAGPPSLDLTRPTWLSLLGLGLGCTVLAYAAWNWGVSRIGASSAGVWLNLEPITGALLGIAFLEDPLTGGILLGGALIMSAAGLVSVAPVASRPRRAAPAAEPYPARKAFGSRARSAAPLPRRHGGGMLPAMSEAPVVEVER